MSSDGPEFNPVMRPDEPLAPFDVTRSSERVGLLKLVIGFGILLIIAFIILKVYQPGVRDRGDPPLITAENTPFKIILEDQGGLQTPDQDKEVFDVMSGDAPSTDVTILPPPEDPIELPTRTERETVPADTVEQPAVQTPTREPIVETPATRPANPPATITSNWIVQVASLRTQAEAQSTYDSIRAKHPSILSAYRSDIARVDLAEKGIYYRARVAGFASKSEADATCRRLKAAGQSCYVARR